MSHKPATPGDDEREAAKLRYAGVGGGERSALFCMLISLKSRQARPKPTSEIEYNKLFFLQLYSSQLDEHPRSIYTIQRIIE